MTASNDNNGILMTNTYLIHVQARMSRRMTKPTK